MTVKYLKLEEKIKKEMEYQLALEITDIPKWVSGQINSLKKSALNNVLGIRTAWGSLEFTDDSEMKKQIKENAQFSLDDFVKKFNIDEMVFTPKEIKGLQQSYKENYINAMERLIEEFASQKAEDKFNETLEELNLPSLEENGEQ